MRFRVKDVNIATGRTLVAILHKKDAQDLDLSSGDRILLKYNNKEITCILDISEHARAVAPGEIGLFEEVLEKLSVKHKDHVNLSFTGKPESVRHIRDKLFGKRLNYKELYHIIDDITNDKLSDIEKTYFVSAGFIEGWNKNEIIHMTKAMVVTGDKVNFKGITLDKHSIGGVPGNRTSMIIIPIIAAAGYTIPKTSSRAITSPAGTADTMECLAKVELPEKKILSVIKKTKACIVHGGSINLAPADDKIIEVEHPLSIDAEGQLIASVMAKKYSVSSNHVLIDIPMGPEVKAKNKKQAKHLKRMFEYVGKHLDMNVKVIITDGTHPIGNGIGPLLEARDVMAVLRNDPQAPQDLRRKSLEMAGTLLQMAGERNGLKLATEILEDCRAYNKMRDIIKAQGKLKEPLLGKYTYAVKSTKSGKITNMDNQIIAKIARFAGCPQDKGSGLFLHKKIQNKVKKGEILYTVYAENEFKLKLAKDLIKKINGYKITS